MKHLNLNALLLAGALGLALNAAAQPADENESNPPPPAAPPTEAVQPAAPPAEVVPPEPVVVPPEPDMTPEPEDNTAPGNDPGSSGGAAFVQHGSQPARYIRPAGATNAADTTYEYPALSTPATRADQVVKDGEKGLRLNFRGAPLELVLNYLSDAAGFIIVPETDVRGKVDVWSNQPLTKDEAVELLNKVLAQQGYAVLRDGRTLTIVTQSEARKRDIPVKTGYEPSNIPKDQQIVTQIIPVRFISATQLAKDLQPLLPTQTTMTANEGGNALVITDTQQNIRRMAEIIKALDTTVSSLSSVKVFALRYADAKTVADMVKEVFSGSDSSRSSSGGRGQFRFGGGPFAAMMGGGGGSETASSGGRPGASKVVATADDRSNSLVVSAPDDLMPTIEELVNSVDTNVDDLTEIRVFRLEHADPQETADLLTSLFPDATATQNNRGGGRFNPAMLMNAGTSTPSDRMKKQSKVIAVPDLRTRSVVVTAARDTMEQISKMLTQLDADPARKQKVFVYEVQNTDPTTVQQTLQDLFSGQSTTSSRTRNNTGQAGTQLNSRAQQQNQNTTTGTRSSGNSSTSSRNFGN